MIGEERVERRYQRGRWLSREKRGEWREEIGECRGERKERRCGEGVRRGRDVWRMVEKRCERVEGLREGEIRVVRECKSGVRRGEGRAGRGEKTERREREKTQKVRSVGRVRRR
jgi:hypothetical protein